jgi:hypothetical protein
MLMPAVDNSWLVYQSTLAVLPAGMEERMRILHIHIWYVNESFAWLKILRHGTSGFTSHPKEGVLRIFIVLINPSPWPGLNPPPLGPVVITLTTTPPRRQTCYSSCHQSAYFKAMKGLHPHFHRAGTVRILRESPCGWRVLALVRYGGICTGGWTKGLRLVENSMTHQGVTLLHTDWKHQAVESSV